MLEVENGKWQSKTKSSPQVQGCSSAGQRELLDADVSGEPGGRGPWSSTCDFWPIFYTLYLGTCYLALNMDFLCFSLEKEKITFTGINIFVTMFLADWSKFIGEVNLATEEYN